MSMIDPIEKSDPDIDQRPFEIEALAARHRAERDLAIQERERLEKEVGLLRGAEHERDMLRDLADVLVVKVIEHPTGRTFVEGLDDAEIDDRIDSIIEAIDRRLMPEGYEWPRYESGELVRIGDKAAYAIGVALDEPVASVEFFEYGLRLHCGGWQAFYGYKERVKRPAALAADGEPLEVGQTVWRIDTGAEYWVKSGQTITADAVVIIRKTDCDCESEIVKASQLTHQRPVLDADGVPIKVGDTVRDTETGCVRTVRAVNDNETVEFDGCENRGWFGKFLTHTKPEPPDSWERIEEDATLPPREYYARYVGHDVGLKDDEEVNGAFGKSLVRRCGALAERERGE